MGAHGYRSPVRDRRAAASARGGPQLASARANPPQAAARVKLNDRRQSAAARIQIARWAAPVANSTSKTSAVRSPSPAEGCHSPKGSVPPPLGCVQNGNRTLVRRAEASRSGGPQLWQACVRSAGFDPSEHSHDSACRSPPPANSGKIVCHSMADAIGGPQLRRAKARMGRPFASFGPRQVSLTRAADGIE